MYAPCCHLKIKFRLYLILFLALVFSAFPTTANINQTAEEEKFRQLGNLVNTVVYMWNSPFGLSNDEITSLIIKSNIQQDSSTLGSVIRAVLYEITATNSDTPRLPIEPIGSVSASDWKYVKEINVKRYVALRALFILSQAANRYVENSERLKHSIPQLYVLKKEALETGEPEAAAVASIWLAMEYSELNPMKAVVELEYALPYLLPFDEEYSLETILDKKLAHSWLADAYVSLNIVNRALKHQQYALEEVKKHSELNAYHFTGVVNAFVQLREFDKAIEMAEEAKQVSKENLSLEQTLYSLWLQTNIYLQRNTTLDRANILSLTENLTKYKDVQLPNSIAPAYEELSAIRAAIVGSEKEFENTIYRYVSTMNERATSSFYDTPIQLNKHQQLRNIYKLRGDFEKALFHQQEYENLLVQSRNLPEQLDNLVNDSPLERDITISKLQRLALSKDKQNLALKAERLQAILFGVVAALTTLLLFWFWRGQRSKAKLGDIDDLTGAFTRRAMFRAVSKPMSSKVTSCLVLIDLDHFKRINDRFGHVVGDEVLSTFGRVTRERIRKTDTFCRYGGEEFLLYLHDTNEDNAATLLKDIKRSMELHTHWQATDEVFSVSFSAGVVEIKGEKNIEKIIKACDHLLYKAKNAGRGKIETVSIQRYFTEQV